MLRFYTRRQGFAEDAEKKQREKSRTRSAVGTRREEQGAERPVLMHSDAPGALENVARKVSDVQQHFVGSCGEF